MMSKEIDNNNLKWILGIVTFASWLIIMKMFILSEWQCLSDIVREESVLSTGQQWAMIICAIALIVVDVKIYEVLKEK